MAFSRLSQVANHLLTSLTPKMAPKNPDITLYTTQTPNGIKISIALEELGSGLLSLLKALG
jgi:hypothetical protein